MVWNPLDKQSPGFFPHKLLSSVCVCFHPIQSWIRGGWINDREECVFGQPFAFLFEAATPLSFVSNKAYWQLGCCCMII